MVTPSPAKTKSDVGKLVEQFNQWADEGIFCDFDIPGISDGYEMFLRGQVDALKWAKINLERLATGILRE